MLWRPEGLLSLCRVSGKPAAYLVGVLGLALFVAAGCQDARGGAPATANTPGAAAPRASGGGASEELAAFRDADLVVEADTRHWSDLLRAALRAGSSRRRLQAALAIGRLETPEAALPLVRALGDPDPEVRAAASWGLGLLGERAPSNVEPALLGALAAESDPRRQAELLTDLGRVSSARATPAFRQALGAPDPQVREAACLAIGRLGGRNVDIDPSLLAEAAARMTGDSAIMVRQSCAFAFNEVRVGPKSPPMSSSAARADDGARSDSVVRSLEVAAADPDPTVRAMATRALGHHPSASPKVLAMRAADSDWLVAIRAFRALAEVGTADDYRRALEQRVDALLRERLVEGPPIHVVAAALGAAPLQDGLVQAALRRVLRNLHRVSRETRSGDLPRLHCQAAQLVDQISGRPQETLACGGADYPDGARALMQAEVLATSRRPEPERLTFLRALLKRPEPATRTAATRALATVGHPDALELLCTLCADADVSVAGVATDSLAVLASRRPRSAASPSNECPTRALDASRDSLRRADHLPGLVAWLRLVRAVSDARQADAVRGLALHHNPAVRAAALDTLEALRLDAPDGHPAAPPNPVVAADLASLPLAARIVTTRGTVDLDLLTTAAPVTVARFRDLVHQRFYDGLSIHVVQPGFLVQAGDPRGDGFGGPGWTQRSERSREPFRPGTVGMALAGPDTAGSQFFITLAREPRLDGEYTAFARVRTGLEVLERLQPGDRIETVRLVDVPAAESTSKPSSVATPRPPAKPNFRP